jgi:hypothetical protein
VLANLRLKVAAIGMIVGAVLFANAFTATASVNVSLFLDETSLTSFVAGTNNTMVADGSGNLYVVGSINNSGVIVKVPINGSGPATVYATASNFGGATPGTITMDSTGNLFVCASDGHVYEFAAGAPANSTPTDYAVTGGGTTYIAAVGANLYISMYNTGTVYSVPLNLSAGLPTSSLTTFATGLAAPGAQGISPDGNFLLVADDANFNGGSVSGVYKLDTTAGPYTNPALWVDTSSDASIVPVDVAADSSGNVFVADYNNRLLSVASGSSTPTTYLSPVTDLSSGGSWGLCLVSGTFFITGTDTASHGNQAVLTITSYDGSSTPATPSTTTTSSTTTTLAPTTTTTVADGQTTTTTTEPRTLAHTGFNSGSIVVASGLFVASGTLFMQVVARARRKR